jgi:tRNA 5-methylaminomethyl-2-thiouridine biosynthesis bifunctional protein
MQFSSIKWINNNPQSIDFNDIYFSSEGGIEETEYVFIRHNQLINRFTNLENNTFIIIETGFGTGLNFYCTALNWLTNAPKNALLHYISIEKFPLAPNDMTKIASIWPKFEPITREFLQNYMQLTSGLNTFKIANNAIRIDLWINDVSTALPQITHKADAWFLDGFAPAKNIEMWNDAVLQNVAKLSHKDTTFATFTSAGNIRRGLQAVGFEVSKHEGFGKKREMLSGKFK